MSVRLLRAVFYVLGTVAMATGLWAVLTGTGGMPGVNEASESVESELRFFAVFWIAYGAVALRTARRAELEATMVRTLSAVLFAAGVARAVAWVASGPPHPLFIALMFVELIGPPLVVAWQSRVASAA